MGDERYLQQDYAAGVREVEIGIHWNQYEPRSGHFDIGYRATMMRKIDDYRRAGYQVSIGAATQYTPDWILKDPSLQQQSQFAEDTSHMANLFFNQAVRDHAAQFIRDIVLHAGPVAFYRVGLSHNGETVFPRAPRGEWWAMDPMAQGDIAGRPASIPDPPFKHWYPGQPLNGQPATQEQLRAWWNWYFNALVDGHDWEIRAYRDAGFRGPIHIVMPGPAVRPLQLDRYFAKGLAFDPHDTYHLMNVAAVWYLFLDRLKERTNLMVDVSSVYDKSGIPRGNGCAVDDDKVDYLHDPSVEDWSSTRWISFNARRNGFPVIGENPGSDSPENMQNVMRLMQQCHLVGIPWAFDHELHEGSFASINDYAHYIRALNP